MTTSDAFVTNGSVAGRPAAREARGRRRALWCVASLSLATACMTAEDFDARITTMAVHVNAEAAAAHRCAAELGQLLGRAPAAVAGALDVVSGASPVLALHPALVRDEAASGLGRRSREDAERIEAAVQADRRVLAAAVEQGPAALDRALRAELEAHHARDALCQARDIASALASLLGPRTHPAHVQALAP